MYGCDVAEAREIIPLRPMTRLPGAPAFVRGLINMRGTIVTVLDLGQRLDPTRAPIDTGSIVLVRHGERLVGLVVDEVLDVRVLEIEARDGAPGRDTGRGDIVRGVAVASEATRRSRETVKVNDSGDAATIVVLDLEALITQVLLS